MLQYTHATNNRKYNKMHTITLQIPFDKYGPLATLAAAANMPIDAYIKQEETKGSPSDK